MLTLVVNDNTKNICPDKTIVRLCSSIVSSFVTNLSPAALILFTAELHAVQSNSCEIISAVYDQVGIVGRIADYDKCIFGSHTKELGRVVRVDNVRTAHDYLEIDSRVGSEVFIEMQLTADVNLILNAEFSVIKIDDEIAAWFAGLADCIDRAIHEA